MSYAQEKSFISKAKWIEKKNNLVGTSRASFKLGC